MYFSTFISGFQELVSQTLARQYPGIAIKQLEDGFVVFATDMSDHEISAIRFFNNTYKLIKIFPHIGTTQKDINSIFKIAEKDKNVFYHIKRKLAEDATSFRIILSKENKMIPPDKNVSRRFESLMTQRTGLSVERSLPDTEIWFFIRRDSKAYLGIRMKQRFEHIQGTERGELRAELAHLLCLSAPVSENDIFLDPFCGTGSICRERVQMYPYRKVIAGDIDKEKVKQLRNRVAKEELDILVYDLDTTKLTDTIVGKVTIIVTDPPWGISIGLDLELLVFYTTMLNQTWRILEEKGYAVFLVGKKDLFVDILNSFIEKFIFVKQLDILVSGKQAGVFVLQKK